LKYENRILAFIDILGFADVIKKSVNITNDVEKENYIETNRICNLLDENNFYLIQKDYLLPELNIESKEVSQFSDTIIISYLEKENIYQIFLDVYFLCRIALVFCPKQNST